MASIHTYLNFNGNTEAAFNHYKSVFGGDFITIQRFKDSPGCDGMKADDLDKIMHIALPIGGSILMGTDITDPMPPATYGTGISLSVDAQSESEAHKIFNGLADGGSITMALEKTSWGALFGMVTDKFGIPWMINYDYK
ncbi:VOC family protein [Pedobacter jejuensis]|uniref:VOC family protein n=1 Tax=Pedobacter jejuensis TaxID=1268550 RepID=A0A3N0BY16_9SPHI|nr:VOC family protein [Pedobacter jejuensis]RNL54595.1 VOC family protein [Pedobacter jejuensis]